jgi:hypothetical protein
MGYCTRYELEVFEGELSISEILSKESEEGTFDGLDYAIDTNGEYEQECKWYEHEADMHFLSLRYPEITFLLSGEGEESGDVWKKYFKNGKMQHCPAVITFAKYNEAKLK